MPWLSWTLLIFRLCEVDQDQMQTIHMQWKMITAQILTKSVDGKSKEPTGRRVSRKRIITLFAWSSHNSRANRKEKQSHQGQSANFTTRLQRFLMEKYCIFRGWQLWSNPEYFIHMVWISDANWQNSKENTFSFERLLTKSNHSH